MTRTILAWVLGGIVTLLYIVSVISAVGNLILLPEMGATIGYGITPVGWAWLIAGIALPVVVYALALVIARRRRAAMRILVLVAGLALVAAVQLEIMLLVPQSSFFTIV